MVILKILSIGNSFSQDSHKWLHQVAASAGEDVCAVNLMIGGCSLETHWKHYLDESDAYSYEVNGIEKRRISLTEALTSEKWDVITLQQVSDLSGDYSTFEPYLTELFKKVRYG